MPEKERKLKVSAPATNPHICYIPQDRAEKIQKVKKALNMSLYKILCTVSKVDLSEKERIKAYKQELRKLGWHNIGEWATVLIDVLYTFVEADTIHSVDLSTLSISK